jgi:hypothetical protein
VSLLPQFALLLIPQMVYEHGDWNDIDGGKPRNSKRNLSQFHCPSQITQWIDPGKNSELCGESPATKHLSCGMVI